MVDKLVNTFRFLKYIKYMSDISNIYKIYQIYQNFRKTVQKQLGRNELK